MMSKYKNTTPPRSLFFAPMEGITDESYRLAIHHLYPLWNFYCTDFLRAPSEGTYPLRILKEHIGPRVLNSPQILNKTVFQILATPKTGHGFLTRQIQDLGINRLDLNLGCPSKTVNGHQGGAYLLSDLLNLKKIVEEIRKNFQGIFTVKMRVGYRDDLNFSNILKILEDCGVEAITIHARTRDQLYRGIANWDYIKKGHDFTSLPLVGNGDIWALEDLENVYLKTGCYAAMMGRGALKTPWFPYLQKEWGVEEKLLQRKQEIKNYFQALLSFYQEDPHRQNLSFFLVKRLKAFCHYLFEDFEQGTEIRSRFLRAETLDDFFNLLNALNSGELQEGLRKT